MTDQFNRYEIHDFFLSGLHLRFAVTCDGFLRVQSIAPAQTPCEDVSGGMLWERVPFLLHLSGEDTYAHYGARSIHSMETYRFKLLSLRLEGDGAFGRLLISCQDPCTGLRADISYESRGICQGIRATASLTNAGSRPVTVEQFLLSFPGLGCPSNAEWPSSTVVHAASNTWLAEAQWHRFSPSSLGISHGVDPDSEPADSVPCFADSLGAARWENIGTWSTIRHLPMGVLEDRFLGVSWFWQLEQSGSWQAELFRLGKSFCIAAGLPSRKHGDWYVTLQPGESTAAAPVAFGCAGGGFEEAILFLQKYRRAFVPTLKSPLLSPLPFLFNDCMQCLQADPTLEKSLPVIKEAARCGAEYYVIDAGWQDPLGAPQKLGDWQESPDRFGPQGLKGLCDIIRAHGMKPGLWLEIECVSAASSLFQKPDSWFLCADGRRVMSFDRYFLNFANPKVRAYAHGVTDRLCREYGMRYLKLDYNADAGTGDNQQSGSLGAGQAASFRGFSVWLDELRRKHPELLIENCASGGQRFDYALLGRCHCQSITDSNDERRIPSILAGSLAAGLPEQVAVWCCAHGGQSDEAVLMNLLTPMLSLWHLSGRPDHLTPAQQAWAQEAFCLWRSRLRHDIPHMFPTWPTPLRKLHEQDCWLAVGLRSEDGAHLYLNIYRQKSRQASCTLFLSAASGAVTQARILFPSAAVKPGTAVSYDPGGKNLTVTLPGLWGCCLVELTV